MIYVNYEGDRFCVSREGYVVADSEGAEGVALFTQASEIAAERGSLCEYYSRRDNLYFLETDSERNSFAVRKHQKAKSLLHALGIKRNSVVGFFTDQRLLLFMYWNDALKVRYPGAVGDVEEFVRDTLMNYNIPVDTPFVIFGHNAPFEALVAAIDRTPPLKSVELERRAQKRVTIAAGVACLMLLAAVGYGLEFGTAFLENEKNTVAAETLRLKQANAEEARMRMPLYLHTLHIPLDVCLKSVSFLEGESYSTFRSSCDRNGMKGVAILGDASRAFSIKKRGDGRLTINMKGGGLEIEFERKLPAGAEGLDHSRGSHLFTY